MYLDMVYTMNNVFIMHPITLSAIREKILNLYNDISCKYSIPTCILEIDRSIDCIPFNVHLRIFHTSRKGAGWTLSRDESLYCITPAVIYFAV